MTKWPSIALRDICEPAKRFEPPQAGCAYRQIGVRLWGEGAYERERIDGSETNYAHLNRVESDDLIVNKIWARNGSIAVVTPELAGGYVSTEFPTFTLDVERIVPGWMRLITKSREFWRACDEAAQGTSGKNRIKPYQFLSIKIPVPTIAEQQGIVARLDALADKTRKLAAHLDGIDADAGAMVLSVHRKLSNSRTVALSELLELHEESEPVQPGGEYPQVGVRSFGRGLFPKAPVEAADTTYRAFNKLYAEAIVLSQVKGWEGALALTPPNLVGRFASPEYRTFRCIEGKACAGYLAELFKTPWFWSKLQGATRGVGARRERTRPEQFLNVTLPMPNFKKQCKAFEVFSHLAQLRTRHMAMREANAALIPATLERLFARRAA